MSDTLSKLLQQSKGEPIMVSGKLVHGIYRHIVKPDSVFTVTPHWDVQTPGGGYVNIYPGGNRR